MKINLTRRISRNCGVCVHGQRASESCSKQTLDDSCTNTQSSGKHSRTFHSFVIAVFIGRRLEKAPTAIFDIDANVYCKNDTYQFSSV